MSVKGSWSRVKDARQFGRNYARIFRRGGKNRAKSKIVNDKMTKASDKRILVAFSEEDFHE